jgi:hypothetical protein
VCGQCILTGAQCLRLTTGLLRRWNAYYPPLAALIRLLALQAICWPATHFTLALLDAAARPAATWAVVGTTTCCSRAVQLWVTSNLVVIPGGGAAPKVLRGRRWDWGEVVMQALLPMGVCYFVMAWADVARRELGWDALAAGC